MKIYTARKVLAMLCSMVVMLALMAGITAIQVNAAVANGIYIATAHPQYKHPETGEMEDSGQNPGIGQGMTESATYKKALVEVDEKGNTFVTVRLQLMDNIENPKFKVDGKDVKAVCMQEKFGDKSIENTADFRMQVKDEKSIIRCNMFVTAMGREVIYFITVSDLQPGNGDFITSIKVKPTKPEPPKPTEPSTPEPAEPLEPSAPESTEPDKPTESTKPTEPTEPSKPTESSTPSSPSETESEDDGVTGLQEFDDKGNKVDNKPTDTKASSGNLKVFLYVLCGAAGVGVIGFCIWYFAVFKKKK